MSKTGTTQKISRVATTPATTRGPEKPAIPAARTDLTRVLRSLDYAEGSDMLSPRGGAGTGSGLGGGSGTGLGGGGGAGIGGPAFTARGDTIVAESGTVVGTFVGVHDGRTRAAIIAERLAAASAASCLAASAFADGTGRWKVRAGTAEFDVRQEDAEANGYACRRLAAHHVASRLSGRPVPKDVADGDGAGMLGQAESDAALAYRANAVQARADGTVLAHGVVLGPFRGVADGKPRAEVIAERLSDVPSPEFRGARADKDVVTIGGTLFPVTGEDALAQGAKTAAEAAKAQAAILCGTWTKGAYAEAGRRVMPEHLGPGALFEFARAIAEGPGHARVSTDPGQVTVLGLRGVWPNGIYDPQLKQQDDLIIPMVVDRQGRRVALKLSGTVDPGGTSGGATQVGDAMQEFGYSNYSGNENLSGTTLLRPSPGIEGKDVSGGLKSYDKMTTKAHSQGATLIHFGTNADQSRGCTVIVDKGVYSENKSTLTKLYNLDIPSLGADVLQLDAGGVRAALDAERAKSPPDKKRAARLEGLLELRLLEAASTARTAGDTGNERQHSALLAGDAAPVEGKSYSAEDLASVANYKAFMSLVYRDPELRVGYVIVDGSKVPEFKP